MKFIGCRYLDASHESHRAYDDIYDALEKTTWEKLLDEVLTRSLTHQIKNKTMRQC